jgi:hypothetical protein
VSADRIIDGALDQDELTVGNCIPALRVIHFTRRKADGEAGHHERHHNFFPERAHELECHNGK